MLNFCPHCGQTIGGQDQVPGKMLTCKYCRKDIGVVPVPPQPRIIDASAELIRKGTAARCSLCQQVVEVRSKGPARTLVPHYLKSEQRKICPNSGKPVPG